MKINFLGDSITAGAWLASPNDKYTVLLSEKLGATENNYGISATRIARQTIPSANISFDQDFLSRLILRLYSAEQTTTGTATRL